MHLNMLNILCAVQRRGEVTKINKTERRNKKFKTEECRDKTEKERINIPYHIFLQEKNPKNNKSNVQCLL